MYDKFVEGNSELDIEIVCFHLQQCAEKLMKSVLSKKQVAFSKIHDIETLLTIIYDNNIVLNTDRDLLI